MTLRLHWDAGGAMRHRVIIRDDTRGVVIAKYETTIPELDLDPKELTDGHRHRWRVQAWSGDGWVDQGGYQTLALPEPPVATIRAPRLTLRAQRDLHDALAALDAGDHRRALMLAPVDGGPVADSVRDIAAGLAAEAAGDQNAAAAAFERAFQLGVPMPELLHATGRYFQRTLQLDRATLAFAMLETLRPGVLRAYADAQPPARRAQLAAHLVPPLLAAARPQLYAMRPIKRDLVAHLGDEGAAAALGAFLPEPRRQMGRRVALTGLEAYVREHGEDVVDLVAPREVHMVAPDVFGRGRGPGIRGRTRRIFAATLRDVVVTGKSNLLLAGDHALMDFQDGELDRSVIALSVDPLVVAEGEDNTLTVAVSAEAPDRIGDALALTGIHSYNFGHWVFEQLFRLLTCRRRPLFGGATLIVDRQMPAQLREQLALLAGPGHPVRTVALGEQVLVDRLWVVPTPAYWPGGELPDAPLDPAAEIADVDWLASLIADAQPRLRHVDHPIRDEWLHLTRKGRRRLINRETVESWFDAHGFRVADFADLSFAEQLALVRNAELVVVEGGSTLFALLFARPGLRIGILAEDPPIGYEWFTTMLERLGHHVLVIANSDAGTDRGGDGLDYTIEPGALLDFVDGLQGMR